MALQYFTLVHIVISLIGIASGFGALSGLLAGKVFPNWTACFLVTTMATSVTGFFFPFRGITPAFVVGIISLLLLAAATYALYIRRFARAWRKVYVVSVLAALYLNTFVLVVQLFQKMPVLIEIAPTQTEPAFTVTQAIVLVGFILLGIAAIRRFRVGPVSK